MVWLTGSSWHVTPVHASHVIQTANTYAVCFKISICLPRLPFPSSNVFSLGAAPTSKFHQARRFIPSPPRLFFPTRKSNYLVSYVAKPHSAPHINGEQHQKRILLLKSSPSAPLPLTVAQRQTSSPGPSSPSREGHSSPCPSSCVRDACTRCGTPRSSAPSWDGQTHR